MAADQQSWPWWWSTDQERYHGPCSSRSDAIMEAWSEYSEQPAHIIQAEHGEIRCDFVSAGVLAEWFDDANEELADGDSDPLSSGIPDAEWQKLAKTVEGQIRALVHKHGVSAWSFASQTEGEWIDFTQPMISGLPVEVARMIAELASAWASDAHWSPSYVDGQIARIKELAERRETVAHAGKYREGRSDYPVG